MKSGSSKALEEVIQAMDTGHTRDAVDAVRRLETSIHKAGKADGDRLSRLWETFRVLLHHRGYFVSTSGELSGSVKEIQETGPGFDLYDLAVAIAKFDMEVAQCLKLLPERLFPELQPFTPRCDCWKRPNKAR